MRVFFGFVKRSMLYVPAGAIIGAGLGALVAFHDTQQTVQTGERTWLGSL